MSVNEILSEAKELKLSEKYLIIENLIEDIHHIDKNIEQAWIEESCERLKLFEDGKLEVVSYEEVFFEN